MNKKLRRITVFILVLSIFLTTGFSRILSSPRTLYRVYLKGESLGLIKSNKELEKYINKEQNEIKKKYNVDKVYVPEDLDIEKEITYSNNVKSINKIYEEIKDISPFTIKGYIIKIKGLDTKNSETGKTIKGKTQSLYVIDKKVFTNSIQNTVKSFISEEDYNAYANNSQKEIEDTGKIIEDISIQNKITIKKGNIPVDKKIYQAEDELSKYLLFGTEEEQGTYTVQAGDTIPDVAFNNKVSTQEFLIANPNLKDENSLLSPGQNVTIGILKPQISIEERDHVVEIETQNYTTETRYDNDKNVGYEEVIQKGVAGENKVTKKVQKVNGETTSTVGVSTEVIKEAVNEIIVKGGKKNSYSGGGYGSVVPTKGQWGWPATCSSVSSPFGWRWGTLHDGTDIAGCGYGSNIFAAQSGTVVQSSYKYDNGQYITIDHHNGYFTMYAHLSARYVGVGTYVEKGQVIGAMGQTGFATGVHLHFGMWYGYPYRGGRAQNAMNFY